MNLNFSEWDGFIGESWKGSINLRDFIIFNYKYYDNDDSFLTGVSVKTSKLFEKVLDLMKKERNNNGLLKVDAENVSEILSHKPGYIDKQLEDIVGLQTDEPLKRSIMPFGGIRIVEKTFKEYGYICNPFFTF